MEKSQKAQRCRARTAAKTKLKEVKQILATADDKVSMLLERLDSEQSEAVGLADEVEAQMKEKGKKFYLLLCLVRFNSI